MTPMITTSRTTCSATLFLRRFFITSPNKYRMRICVLVPAYNEQIVMGPTIQSLVDSGFKSSDVFIVDDCSTDDTKAIALKYTDNVVTVPSNGGKAAAQAYAIDVFKLNYKYDYVIMLDCDSFVTSNFKDILYAEAYKRPDVDLFVGQVVNARNKSLISSLRAVEYTFSHDLIKKGQDNFGVIYVSPGCASMYSTRMLKRLVFDSNTLAEDMDLTLQVHKLGGRIKYIHDAEVVTQDPKTISDYLKQITRWYRGFWQIVDKYNILKLGFRSRVSLYMLYIILDTLIANRVLIILLSVFFLPLKIVMLGLLTDFIVLLLLSLYASLRTKRYDVFMKTPLFYPLLFLNAYAFVVSFVEVIVLRKKAFGWNKVMRYKGERNEEDSIGAMSSASNTSFS
jgi:cellulose synthase/poly-beta-1,6-N-acetylglucosamine synthase-like glycosyltransferase